MFAPLNLDHPCAEFGGFADGVKFSPVLAIVLG
jgi:hypothetical protein